MNCQATQQWFLHWMEDPSVPMPVELRSHLESCPVCRATVAFLLAPFRAPSESDVEKRIREMLVSSLTPVRPLPSRANLMARFAACMIASAAGVAAWTGVQGAASFTWPQLAMMAACTIAALLLLTYALSTLLEPGARRKISPYAALSLGALLMLFSYTALFPWRPEAGLFQGGWICARVLVVGFVPVAALVYALMKRGTVVEPVGAAAAAVAAAAFSPLVAIEFACPVHEASHVLIWHWGVWVALALAGVLVVWAKTRTRR